MPVNQAPRIKVAGDKITFSLRGGQRAVVMLDSNHSAHHEYDEMIAYSPLVQTGDYLIVEDTNVNGHPACPDFSPGSMEGVDRFLSDSDEFVADRRCERFLIRPACYVRENIMRLGILMVPFVAVMLLAAGCGKSLDQQAKEDAARKLNDAGKQMEPAAKDIEDAAKRMEQAAKNTEDAAKKAGQGVADPTAKMGIAVGGAVGEAAKSVGTAVEHVDFRELKDLLPASIGALKLTSTVGEKDGGLGIVLSHAEGRYHGDDGSMNLTITDPGTLSAFAATAAIWMNMELDRETDNGYEKTGTANGRRYHEVYDNGSNSGEYAVIVGNRFMVEIHGNGIDMPTIKQAIDQIDLAKLESMKDVGVKK
jgi:hypothetical protein